MSVMLQLAVHCIKNIDIFIRTYIHMQPAKICKVYMIISLCTQIPHYCIPYDNQPPHSTVSLLPLLLISFYLLTPREDLYQANRVLLLLVPQQSLLLISHSNMLKVLSPK